MKEFFEENLAMGSRRLIIVVGVFSFLFVVVVLFDFAGVIDDFMKHRHFIASLEELSPHKKLSTQEALQIVDNLQRFSINEQKSTNEWITVDNNTFEAVGTFLPYSDTIYVNEERFKLAVFAVPETVSETTVFHLLPLVVTSEMQPEAFEASELSLYVATFSVQDRWLRAETIEVANMRTTEDKVWERLPDTEVYFQSLYYDEGQTYFPECTYWLSVSDGEMFTWDDFEVDNILSSSKYAGIYDMNISGRFGSARIFHSFQVHSNGTIDATRWMDAPIELKDGKFVFVDGE